MSEPSSHALPELPVGTPTFVHDGGRQCWWDVTALRWNHLSDAAPAAQRCDRDHPSASWRLQRVGDSPVDVRPMTARPHHRLCEGQPDHGGLCRCRCGAVAQSVAPSCAWHTSDDLHCACGQVGIHTLTVACGHPVPLGGEQVHRDCMVMSCSFTQHAAGHPHENPPVPARPAGRAPRPAPAPAHEVRHDSSLWTSLETERAELADRIRVVLEAASSRPAAEQAYRVALELLAAGWAKRG